MGENSHLENLGENINQPEQHQPFQDIINYFTEDEWARLNRWQKCLYLYMRRNFNTSIGLGIQVKLPFFMRSKEQANGSSTNDSSEDHCHEEKPTTIELPSDEPQTTFVEPPLDKLVSVEIPSNEPPSDELPCKHSTFDESFDITFGMPQIKRQKMLMNETTDQSNPRTMPGEYDLEGIGGHLHTCRKTHVSEMLRNEASESRESHEGSCSNRLRKRKHSGSYEEISDHEDEEESK